MSSNKVSLHRLVQDLIKSQKMGLVILFLVYILIIFALIQGNRASIYTNSESWSTFFINRIKKYSETSLKNINIFPEVSNGLHVYRNGDIIDSTNKSIVGINIKNSRIFDQAEKLNYKEEIVLLESGIIESKLMSFYIRRERSSFIILTLYPEEFFPITSTNTIFLVTDNQNIIYSTIRSLLGSKFNDYPITFIQGKVYFTNKVTFDKSGLDSLYLLQDGTQQIILLIVIGVIISIFILYLNKNLFKFKSKLEMLEEESNEINNLAEPLSVIDSISKLGVDNRLQSHKEVLIKFIYAATAKKVFFEENFRKLERYRSLSESLLTLLTKVDRIIVNLNDAKSRYKSIYENSQEGIFQSTLNGRIISANNTLAKILGFESESDLIGSISSRRYKPFKEREERINFYKNIAANKTVKEFEAVFLNKNGEDIFVVISGIGVNDELGNLLYVQGSVRDLTIEQIAKRLREDKERAEAISKTKSAFLANISHELRTPLNAVIGFSELLAMKVKDKQLKEYTNAILIAGKSLLTLITDVLDLSKVEANKMEIIKKPTSLRSIVDDITQVFSIKAHRKSIEISSQISDSVPDYIYIDEARIRQVLINLVGNAMKFTDRGYIKIKADIDSVENNKIIPNLIIEVEDSGRGIDKEDLDKVFEEFRQVGSQKGIKGSGLGLAICKRLLSLMDGSISVSSELGKGSRFYILIKNVDIAKLPHESVGGGSIEPLSVVFNDATILIVDDTEQVRDYLKEALTMLNLVVFAAEDGRSGLQMLETVKPDLVILDLKMPDMDGVEVCNNIKNSPEYSNIPVIAFTASVQDEELAGLEYKGFDGILKKPVKLNDLTNVLTKYLKYSSIQSNEKEKAKTEVNYKLSEECKQELMPVWPRIKNNGLVVKMKDVELIIEILTRHKFNKIVQVLNYLKSSYDIEGIEKILTLINTQNEVKREDE